MENELLSAEEKVLQHYLNIMNRSEIGSEEHTKALKGYMELKDRVIQSKRIEHEKYYKDKYAYDDRHCPGNVNALIQFFYDWIKNERKQN